MARRLFVDMDGVLVDFDRGYEEVFGERPEYLSADWDKYAAEKWARIDTIEKFFFLLKPMPDALYLWGSIARHSPTILTGIPKPLPYVAGEKCAWIQAYFGAHVPVITCFSADKHLHGRPGDILIDDRVKCGQPWTEMGGVWIEHKSALKSLAALAPYIPELSQP